MGWSTCPTRSYMYNTCSCLMYITWPQPFASCKNFLWLLITTTLSACLALFKCVSSVLMLTIYCDTVKTVTLNELLTSVKLAAETTWSTHPSSQGTFIFRHPLSMFFLIFHFQDVLLVSHSWPLDKMVILGDYRNGLEFSMLIQDFALHCSGEILDGHRNLP